MQENIPLKDYTTMKIGGPARYMATANSREELVSLVQQAGEMPILVLGQGSNVIVGDGGFAGLVILNRIMGFEIYDQDPAATKIRVGAGEIWDSVVQRSTENGLSGIECLSAIPGCSGAAPVQNIGAYGQEIADTLIELEAYDLQTKQFATFNNSDCDFTYRRSIFNSGSQKGRYVITSISLQLQKTIMQPPFYSSLQTYLDKNQITDYSPYNLRNAVVAVRANKLPDPKLIPNTGSFFRNPIIENWQASKLRDEYPDVKVFPMGDNLSKISAGWLVENTGIKDLEIEGFKVYDSNALVI
ncbi:UDP-N-acetylmuramate dehydrogenase, partial [Candidatus Saccharibacteria bacterium]|nr:UDP-N-acetylmuramate dehydrogenase [Candidatus Saccharibacteria bacterium]